jgi:hypothetical protein
MIGPGGEISVSLHSLRTKRNGFPPHLKTIELETELSDGTFVVTSNTLEAAPLPPVPLVDSLKFPRDTDSELLLQAHSDRIAKRLGAPIGISATTVSTVEEAYKFQQRLHAIVATNWRERGYLTREDFAKIKGRSLSVDQEGMVEEFEKLKAAERKSGDH